MQLVLKLSLKDLVSAYHLNSSNDLFKEILWQLENYSEEWEELIYDLKVFKPKCQALGHCPEKYSCGAVAKKNAKKGEETK